MAKNIFYYKIIFLKMLRGNMYPDVLNQQYWLNFLYGPESKQSSVLGIKFFISNVFQIPVIKIVYYKNNNFKFSAYYKYSL